MFLQLISLLIPALIATNFYQSLKTHQRKFNIKIFINYYLIFLLAINVICHAIVIYIFKHQNLVFTSVFFVKYSLLSLIVAIFLPILVVSIKINIEIKKNNDKK